MAKKAHVTREREVRLYKNDFLEALTRVHPAVPLCIWGPFSLGLIYLGYYLDLSVNWVAGLALAGGFIWTFTEYVLHRWVFHFEPKNEKLKEIFYPVHQLHHDVHRVGPAARSPDDGRAARRSFSCRHLLPAARHTDGVPVLRRIPDWLPLLRLHPLLYALRQAEGTYRKGTAHAATCSTTSSGDNIWYGVSSPMWDYVFRTHMRKEHKARVS